MKGLGLLAERTSSRPPPGATTAAVLLAVAVLAIGCGASSSKQSSGTSGANTQRTVNTEQVEKGIESSLSTSSVKVTKATCPSDVPVQQGATFTCNVTLSNGATARSRSPSSAPTTTSTIPDIQSDHMARQ